MLFVLFLMHFMSILLTKYRIINYNMYNNYEMYKNKPLILVIVTIMFIKV